MTAEYDDRIENLVFAVQIGLEREAVTVALDGTAEFTTSTLTDIACAFVDRKFPEHGFYNLRDKILLFRHDPFDSNILKLITSAKDVVEGTLVEVVLSARTTMEELQIRPHVLHVHSYKSPHFCDFCGEMLFGLVKQGLKCEGCGLNFHKRCAYKIPNNCNYVRRKCLSPGNGESTPLSCVADMVSTASLTASPVHTDSPLLDTPSPSCSASAVSLPVSTSRSKSWSGRPLWMEKEYASRIKVPHTFVVHNYTRPTICQLCKKLLKGLFRQGVQCKGQFGYFWQYSEF